VPSLVIVRTLEEVQADVARLVGGISPAARERDRSAAAVLVREAFELGQQGQQTALVRCLVRAGTDPHGPVMGYSGAI
jgi:hypothetical protein